MGMREQVVTVKKQIPTCDVCGKDCHTSQQTCFVCGRKGGYCCVTGRQLAGKNGHLIELYVCVCKDCTAAGNDVAGTPFPDLIYDSLAKADAEASSLIARWKAWSEERRAKAANGGNG